MILNSIFLDEENDDGRTKLEQPLPEGQRLLAVDEETLRALYAARNRDEKALTVILGILADPTVVKVRVVADRAVIEYVAQFERDARRN